jgi:hypothetical protein
MEQRLAKRGWGGVSVLMLRLLVVGAIGAAAPTISWSQGASIEELEQRLQKAKEEKARRDAAAARSRAESEAAQNKRNAEASREAAERKALEARLAVLVVQSDAACTLNLNGKEVAQLPKGITEVKVVSGQSLVSCTSREENVSFEGEVEARSGQNTVLRITLAERVQAAQRSRREAEEKVQRERREAEARAAAEAERKAACDRGVASIMMATGDPNVLRQCSDDRLLWTRADNGGGLNWLQARVHCQGLGSGWSLPTVAQLQSLYDKNLPEIPCGSSTCNVSNQFRLSSVFFWTSEPNGSSEGWLVNLLTGYRIQGIVGYSAGRALCVRRP